MDTLHRLPGMDELPPHRRYRELLKDVADWAEAFGGRLVLGEPASDDVIDLVPEMLGLRPSAAGPALPPGLRAFWRLCSFARVEVPDASDGEDAWTTLPANFRVYSPDEVLESTGKVHIPMGVKPDGRPLTTSHLFAIAACDVLPRDAQWCVAPEGGTRPGPVIVRNHMDELGWARFQDTGRFVWAEKQLAHGPVFGSFRDWLEHYVRHACQIAPEDLYPDGVVRARPTDVHPGA